MKKIKLKPQYLINRIRFWKAVNFYSVAVPVISFIFVIEKHFGCNKYGPSRPEVPYENIFHKFYIILIFAVIASSFMGLAFIFDTDYVCMKCGRITKRRIPNKCKCGGKLVDPEYIDHNSDDKFKII